MKFKAVLLFLFISSVVFAQREASNWYFGGFAGMRFNTDGSTTLLTDSQMLAHEGCAAISDTNGQLLFYTNGITVYNRNHQIMANGNGLAANYSTTQAATMVLKPGTINQYYVFTLDEQTRSNGFQYSVVDMSLDGGLGAVTNEKNIPVYAPSCEKLAIVKHANGIDYWVVTHGWNNNSYYAHLLTSSGLTMTPVTSNIGAVLQGDYQNTIGYMKISPDGTKMAVCHNDLPSHTDSRVELMDFDTATGIVSNNRVLLYDEMPYGIEFSPNSQLLYQPSKRYDCVFQYDLNVADIANSRTSIHQNAVADFGALQLGPNGKIYVARANDTKLSVINNPDLSGVGCDFVYDGVDLAGKTCFFGLPPFVSSYFRSSIDVSSNCEDESIAFTITTGQAVVSAVWDFGDGSVTQNSVAGNHLYTNPGTYTVEVTYSTAGGNRVVRKTITIYAKPTINAIVALKQCDDNTDGFSAFNLTQANSLVSANYQNETFRYFETAADAQNNVNPITNFTAYTNQVVSNDVVYVKAMNANGCFRVAQLDLNVSTTQIPAAFTRSFTVCDDAVQGTNTDGISAFDFSSVTGQIQGIFPVGQQLVITYYRNLADALAEQNAITDTANYRNIGYPNTQTIYIRVDSAVNNDCLGLGQHITLNVERIPVVQPQVLQTCDDDQDGQFGFDTTNLQSDLLNGLTNVTVAYFDRNNNPLPSPLPNPFVTASQTIRAVVANTTPTACDYSTTIQFIVDDLPEAFAINAALTTVCDDEPNPVSQDGKYAFDTSSFQNTILGSQTGMTVLYFDQNNTPLPSPLPNPFITATQNVRVEVINPANTSCKAVYTIPFEVHPVPKINLSGNEIVCNALTIAKTLDAGIVDGTSPAAYTYVWSKDGVVIPNETGYSLSVNQEGNYSVEVTNVDGCSRARAISVVASDLATITDVEVNDLSDNNTVTVTVSGDGDYVYSLNNVDFQTSNTFDHVPAGVYTLYVQDLNGCGTASMEISVLGIPNYFTPNGDGYHDYWSMEGIGQRTSAKVMIFDRFGKLIKQISPQGQGWDGTYAGNPLPSADYWYTVELQDGRILKGHFAMKR